jgi:GAF domain-containing protein
LFLVILGLVIAFNTILAPSPEAVARLEQQAVAKDQPTAVSVNGDGQIENLARGTPLEASEQTASEIQNVLVSPIKLQNQTIGAIQLHETERPRQWDERELALVQVVAEQVAQTAENLRLFEETRQRAGREATIREITQKIRQAPNLEALSQIAAETLSSVLDVSDGIVRLNVGVDSSRAREGNSYDS